MRRCSRDTAGSVSARAAAKRIPNPRPAEAGARRPRPAHLRAQPRPSAALRRRRRPARLYTALFWSRALIGRLWGRHACALRGGTEIRGRGASAGTRDRGGCVTELCGPAALTSPRGASRPPFPFCSLSVALYVSERARVAQRAAENRSNSCFREGVARWHYASHKPHGGSARTLPDASPSCSSVIFCPERLSAPSADLRLPFLPLPLQN